MTEIIVSIAVLLFLLQAIAGPLLVRLGVYARNRPEIVPIDPGRIPQPVADTMLGYCRGLEHIGFAVIGFFDLPDFMPNAHTTFALFLNDGDKTWAIVAAVQSKVAGTCYMEFCTEFRDATELCTNNSKELQGFVKTPGKSMFQFPAVSDASLLYQAHTYLRNAHFGNRTVALNGVGEEVKYLETALTKDLVKQAELGYYYLNRSGTKFRPTLKGAALMTWRLMWPIGTIRKILQRHAARGILKEVIHRTGGQGSQ